MVGIDDPYGKTSSELTMCGYYDKLECQALYGE